MRFFIAALALLATPAVAQNQITDKASCMKALSRATWALNDIEEAERGWQMRFDALPDEETADDLVAAHVEIERQRHIIADKLLNACADYD